MILTSVFESAYIKASLLLNQNNSKKSNKAVLHELVKMNEIFGVEFEKNLYKTILEELDFKDFKAPVNSTKSPKVQYLIQEFPSLLERNDFLNIFSSILDTTVLNPANKVTAFDFFDCLFKLCKLNTENQLKLLISMNFTSNEVIQKEAGKVFASKCKEIEKEINLSKDYLQILMTLARMNCPENSKIIDLFSNCLNKHLFENYSAHQASVVNLSTSKENKDSPWVLDSSILLNEVVNSLSTNDRSMEVEKIYCDLGPMLINNGISIEKSNMFDFDITEERLANFILYLLRHQQINEDKELRTFNKTFLKVLENDLSMTIDDSQDKKIQTGWNIESFQKMMKPYLDNLNQAKVIEYLDNPLFIIKDKKTLDHLINILTKLKFSSLHQLLFNFIFKTTWNNRSNQIELLNFLIFTNSHDIFPYRQFCKRIKKYNNIPQIGGSGNKLSQALTTHAIEAFSCLEVVQSLLRTSKESHFLKVKETFEWAIENIPETLVLVLTELNITSEDYLAVEILRKSIPIQPTNIALALYDELIKKDLNFLIKCLGLVYKQSVDSQFGSKASNEGYCLNQILEICHKTGILLKVLSGSTEYSFTIPLALVSVKKEYLNLEQWLTEQILKVGEPFVDSIIIYVRNSILSKYYSSKKDQDRQSSSQDNQDPTSQHIFNVKVGNSDCKENILENAYFNLESLSAVFSAVSPEKIKNLSKRTQSEVSHIYKQIFEIFDDLYVQSVNSEEVEEKTNSIFDKYFKAEINITDLITMLKQYKNSSNIIETETFALMVYSVLDEYRFINKYPENQLKAISVLFGQLIANKLFEGIIESIALKYVIQSLSNKDNASLFLFGITCIDQVLDKISVFPNFFETVYKLNIKGNPILDKVNEKYAETFMLKQTSAPSNPEKLAGQPPTISPNIATTIAGGK